MFGILIFSVVLVLVIAGLRYLGAKTYPIFYPEEKPKPAIAEKEAESLQDEDLIAVISAAASVAINKPFLVRRIRFIDPHNDDLAWKRAGRLSIMSSHTVQHK
jgi:Na+-transporting methylmalonyl-CoA/oxaloacetate decarboxylase gamma subunit